MEIKFSTWILLQKKNSKFWFNFVSLKNRAETGKLDSKNNCPFTEF